MPKSKSKPPSRERYDESHPVVAIRITLDMLKEMEALRARGRSWGDILRVGLQRQAAADQSLEAARQEGRRRGYEEARARYAVIFPCVGCGQAVEVTGEQAKTYAAQAFVNGRWRHGDCLRQRR